MLLTDIGKCADDCWRAIPFHFPHVQTLSWVVMPDHIHGVLVINPIGVPQNPIVALVETQNFASLPPSPSSPPSPPQDMAPNHIANNQFGPQSKNLASVIRGFKIGVSKFARQHNLPFGWQPRYHEHIVRNSEALNRITKYIENNVSNWIPIIGDNRMSDIPDF